MANPIWPSTLPNPEYGFGEGDVEGMFIRTSQDAGVAKQRLRYTAVAIPVTSSLKLTRAQYAVFDTFVKTTLKYVLAFDWHNMFTDSGVVTYRFTKKPRASRTGYDEITVDMDMEILP